MGNMEFYESAAKILTEHLLPIHSIRVRMCDILSTRGPMGSIRVRMCDILSTHGPMGSVRVRMCDILSTHVQ